MLSSIATRPADLSRPARLYLRASRRSTVCESAAVKAKAGTDSPIPPLRPPRAPKFVWIETRNAAVVTGANQNLQMCLSAAIGILGGVASANEALREISLVPAAVERSFNTLVFEDTKDGRKAADDFSQLARIDCIFRKVGGT